MKAPDTIDGKPLTENEKEAYAERWAVCVEDGHITAQAADSIAMDSVRILRKIRERRGR